jgi:hypothetical protein
MIEDLRKTAPCSRAAATLCTIALLSSLAAPQPPARAEEGSLPGAIPAIGRAEPVVGQVVEIGTRTEIDLEMSIDIEHGAGSMQLEMHLDGVEVNHVVPLAIRDGRVERFRIDYLERCDTTTTGEAVEEERSPLEGNSYEVRLRGKKPKVRYASGGRPSADELDEVLLDHDVFEGLGTFAAEFPAELLVVGSAFELSGDQLEAVFGSDNMMLGGDEGYEIGSVRVALAEVGQDGEQTLAVYEFEFEFEVFDDEGGFTMSGAMAGAVEVDVDTGWVQRCQLSGPVSMHGEDASDGMYMELRGSGTIAIEAWERVAPGGADRARIGGSLKE